MLAPKTSKCHFAAAVAVVNPQYFDPQKKTSMCRRNYQPVDLREPLYFVVVVVVDVAVVVVSIDN